MHLYTIIYISGVRLKQIINSTLYSAHFYYEWHVESLQAVAKLRATMVKSTFKLEKFKSKPSKNMVETNGAQSLKE